MSVSSSTIRCAWVGGIVDPGQLEHPPDVVVVVLTDLGVLVLAVVRLVGQSESALADEHHVAVRVAGVGLGVDADQAADPARASAPSSSISSAPR